MIVVILIYAALVSVLLCRAGNHPWGLIGFNDNLVLDNQTQVPARFISSEYGYDGQAYFVLALSPLVKDPGRLGFRLDNQSLRQQRILYPLIINVLAGGDSSRTAWFMIIVNIMAVGGLVALAALFFFRIGQPSWLAVLVGLYPGFAISVSRCLTEPLALVWIVWALLVWKRRPSMAGVFLSLGVLSRETSLLVAAGFGLAWLLGIITRKSQTPPARVWVLPLVTYLLWQGFLLHWVGDSSVSAAASNSMGLPLAGLMQALCLILDRATPDQIFFLGFIVLVLGWQLFVAKTVTLSWNPLFFGWILYGLLLCVAGVDIWSNSPGLLRVAGECNLLGLFLIACSGFRRWRPVVIIWSLAWILSAGAEWYRYGLIGFQ